MYADVYNTIIDVNKIKDIMKKFKTPIYILIGTNTDSEKEKTFANIRKEFPNYSNKQFKTFDDKSEEKHISNILSKEPKDHTFIFYKKEMLRCVKNTNIFKKYIGIIYSKSQSKDDVIFQGLLGRMNSYTNEFDKKDDVTIQGLLGRMNSYDSEFDGTE